jgi:Tape measure protein
MSLEFFIRLREMVSSGLVKMADTARKTSSAIKRTNDTLAQSYDTIKNKVGQLESVIEKSTSLKQIREARIELGKLQRMASTSPGNIGGGGLFGGSLRQLLPVLGIAGALSLGGQTVQTALGQDSAGRAINFATGGKGDEAISSVKGINKKYGLSDEAGIEGFKTLAGSVRSLNIPLKETLRIYESVGAAAGAMGVNAENQKGIFLALGQIASKGTVSAEELRGQIGQSDGID